jgi:protein-S-isoprenylcysteine O-methyltransferase Ste14
MGLDLEMELNWIPPLFAVLNWIASNLCQPLTNFDVAHKKQATARTNGPSNAPVVPSVFELPFQLASVLVYTIIAHGQGTCLYQDMVRKVLAIVGSAVFLVIAPGFVAGLVPRWISRWRLAAPLFGMPLFRFVGGILIALGFAGLLDSFVGFAAQGVGTPAPVFPTRHLVVTGLYRYVRNPMYIAVVSTIFGQGLVFGNVALLEYGGLVWLLFHL